MKKKYIFLGNGEEWCIESASLLLTKKNVEFINGFPSKSKFFQSIVKNCYSNRIPAFIKSFYMPLIHKKALKNIIFSQETEKRLCVYDWNPLAGDEFFLRKVRKNYPNIKIAYIFTNVCRITGAVQQNYIDKLNDWYDVVFAFDPEDAKKYNFGYSPLIYDAKSSYDTSNIQNKENIAFYVGQAKDRLSELLLCFKRLKTLGIRTNFHIANVQEKDIKYQDEIVYNKFMSYDECVNEIQHSSCLIDVIQGDSAGLTIKTCEAICYDKKLITTNQHIKEYSFYDPRYIRIIESPDDIDTAFFTCNEDVKYSKDAKKYFSAVSFIERLEKELNRK